jgi:hypothetical protein
LTCALLPPVNVSTVNRRPPIVFDAAVALLAAAALRNPCGVIQSSSCCAHGVVAFTTIVWLTG